MDGIDFPATVTVVTRTVTGKDKYGNPLYTTTETPGVGWVVWPSNLGNESVQGQEVITDTLTGIAPTDTNIDAISSVRVQLGAKTRTYEVQGNTWLWTSPYDGFQPGIQVNLKAVSG